MSSHSPTAPCPCSSQGHSCGASSQRVGGVEKDTAWRAEWGRGWELGAQPSEAEEGLLQCEAEGRGLRP